MENKFGILVWLMLLLQALGAKLSYVDVQKPVIESNFCRSVKSYTALGDSYAAGLGSREELPTCGNNDKSTTANCTSLACHKDKGAYGYLFAEEFNVPNFQYLACTGYSTTRVLNDQVNKDDGADFGKDDLVPDLVTLGVGGDDGNFFRETAQKCVFFRTSHDECAAALSHAEDEIETLPDRMADLADAIKARIKADTKVVVFSYARFFNLSSEECGFWFDGRVTDDEKVEIDRLVRVLNRQLERAAERAGFIWANVDDDYEGHRFCDVSEPDDSTWFQIVIKSPPSPFHPTFNGQKAYLNALKRALKCS